MDTDTSKQDIDERLASQFLSRFFESGEYRLEPVAQLVEMSLSDDERTAKPASKAIFTSLVERLADSFDPASVPVYNRLLAQLIERSRRSYRGRAIDQALASFGLTGEEEMIARAERLRRVEKLDLLHGRARIVRRVIVLSRVTIGADVAITSVIIERMRRDFPDAEISLVGGGKARELFGGDPRLRFPQIEYRRAGTAIERLLGWLDLLATMSELTEGARHGESLIIDPDSRLTQLGLLPVSSFGEYIFFPSREYGADADRSLAQLVSAWLDEVFGSEQAILPRLSLSRNDLDIAAGVRRQLNRSGERPVVAINFGVGGNSSKRAGDHFEKALIGSLVGEGAIILFDKGSGEEEAARADRALGHALAARPGARAVEADEEGLERLLKEGNRAGTDLLIFRGRIGLLAAMIGQSDLYIGYDSAGQHIAAALGVPCIDVFAGFSSPRMLDRWRPTGPAPVRVIAVDTLSAPADEEKILSETLGQARRFLRDEDHHT